MQTSSPEPACSGTFMEQLCCLVQGFPVLVGSGPGARALKDIPYAQSPLK